MSDSEWDVGDERLSLYDTVVRIPVDSIVAKTMFHNWMPRSIIHTSADGSLVCVGDSVLSKTIEEASAELSANLRRAVSTCVKMSDGRECADGSWAAEECGLASDGTQFRGTDYYWPLFLKHVCDDDGLSFITIPKEEADQHIAVCVKAHPDSEARIRQEASSYETHPHFLSEDQSASECVRLIAETSESASLLASFLYRKDRLAFSFSPKTKLPVLEKSMCARFLAFGYTTAAIEHKISTLVLSMMNERARSGIFVEDSQEDGVCVETSIAALLMYQEAHVLSEDRFSYAQTLEDLLLNGSKVATRSYQVATENCPAHFLLKSSFYAKMTLDFERAYGHAPRDHLVP